MASSLIVNADDLGYDPAIDRGILAAADAGVVSSTTVMANLPNAPEAVAAARSVAGLGLGLHVNLARGPALSGEPCLLGRDGTLDASSLDTCACSAIVREIGAQLARFTELAGGPPTHLDFHKHLHRHPPVLEAAIRVAKAHRLPVRSLDTAMRALLRSAGLATPDAFIGGTGAQPYWTKERLLTALDGATTGVTELMCHPGFVPERVTTSYGAQRAVELSALLDPKVVERVRRGAPTLATFQVLH